MIWIKDHYGEELINLAQMRSIYAEEHTERIIASDGKKKFVLFEGAEKGDAIKYLYRLSINLKAIS